MLELKIRYIISEDMLEKIKEIEGKLSKIHIEEQNKYKYKVKSEVSLFFACY